jgi:hypothetical protein
VPKSPDISQPSRTPSATPQRQLQFRPASSESAAVEKVGTGTLCVLQENGAQRIYGRAITVADLLNQDRILLNKWARRLINWNGRQMDRAVWEQQALPLLEKKLAGQRTPVVRFVQEPARIVAHLSVEDLTLRVPVDSQGLALWRPLEREVMPPDCGICPLASVCRELPTTTGVALLWRRLGLIDVSGVPTRRGRVAGFFSQGDGLAIAAALEDERYPIQELVYDLADLDASFRFCGEDNRWAGRLAAACQRVYGSQSAAGYLENGVPPKYGAGAEQVVAALHKDPLSKHAWVTELLGPGDIDRVIIEWRSTLRQVAHAPDLEWPRWHQLQQTAREILHETESPTLTSLPPLEYHQTKRVDHRLILRRH